MNLSLKKIFFIFLRLGCLCFGGPIAHLSFFHHEFVERRKWVDEKTYMGLVALCQSLPGPASSQVATALGMKKGGFLGGIIALAGFLLPATLALIFAAYGIDALANNIDLHWLDGLKLAVVAIVAQAILSMSRKFCNDKKRFLILILSTLITLFFSGIGGQLAVIAIGAVIGKLLLSERKNQKADNLSFIKISTRIMFLAWALLLTGFFLLPLIEKFSPHTFLQFFDIFFRTGALVFGGGHVILPLLQAQIVTPHFVNNDIFLVGYGLTQALPGPLFSFAAFLGTIIGGWSIGLICLIAVYLPSILILFMCIYPPTMHFVWLPP
jgi:chromate transporter